MAAWRSASTSGGTFSCMHLLQIFMNSSSIGGIPQHPSRPRSEGGSSAIMTGRRRNIPIFMISLGMERKLRRKENINELNL
ncbi:hypothetical protein J6590_024435 [Homalodisca vitripennis]|nr:hypothetical protein J6590_024435 [Homalodisca vitripennis]